METQHDLFEGYKFPQSNVQEILLTLIIQGHVSMLDYPYLSGYRARISEITGKHGIILNTKKKTRKNKFKNPYTYSIHHLPLHEKDNAIKLYNSLNK